MERIHSHVERPVVRAIRLLIYDEGQDSRHGEDLIRRCFHIDALAGHTELDDLALSGRAVARRSGPGADEIPTDLVRVSGQEVYPRDCDLALGGSVESLRDGHEHVCIREGGIDLDDCRVSDPALRGEVAGVGVHDHDMHESLAGVQRSGLRND